jgi:hypothetical protein
MAKHRKTREEKIRSTNRQKTFKQDMGSIDSSTPSSAQTSSPYAYKLPTTSSHHAPKSAVHTLSYDYISKDLIHTLYITGTIILAQIILYVLLQSR